MLWNTDNGHPERAFFQKFETFGLGQTNWAEILWGIWGISGQTISTILALWVPCPSERVAGSLSYKKLWFSGLKHITLKYSQNKIWAVKNSGNSVHTSVFGGGTHKLHKVILVTVLCAYSSSKVGWQNQFPSSSPVKNVVWGQLPRATDALVLGANQKWHERKPLKWCLY